jgi:hypothetical protein
VAGSGPSLVSKLETRSTSLSSAFSLCYFGATNVERKKGRHGRDSLGDGRFIFPKNGLIIETGGEVADPPAAFVICQAVESFGFSFRVLRGWDSERVC